MEYVSPILINLQQDFCIINKRKIIQNCLAWKWRINNFATCCPVQQDCYYVTIKFKHNRFSKFSIILVSFTNCGWYCDLWGSLWCNKKLRKSMRLRNVWTNAANSIHFIWDQETPVFWQVMALRLGYYGPPLLYSPDFVPRKFHFLLPLKK
jgi:hypothetical protein